jgi:CBS-domain-containing membrane protein
VPTDSLDHALEQFVEHDLMALPIVDGETGRHFLGIVERGQIGRAYLQNVHGPRSAS